MMPTCTICDNDSPLDEHGRCAGCVIDVERRAILLQDLEAAVTHALEGGVTADQLREALKLSLANRAGTVADGLIGREPVGTSERGLWDVHLGSSFLHAEAG